MQPRFCFSLVLVLQTLTHPSPPYPNPTCSYYFLAFPSFDFTVPGAAGTVRGGITFNISAIEPLDMVNNMVATEDIYFVDQIPSEYTVTPKVRIQG